MVVSSPVLGTMLHAIGGVSASSCYVPYQKTKSWSWGTFWLVQAVFAWMVMPVVVGYLTVSDFFAILAQAPFGAVSQAFLLGAVYGFGSMAFGVAIRYIGYSLTYTLAIGISAVVGTVLPLLIFGGIDSYFSGTGGAIVLAGMLISLLGVAGCGWAGFRREHAAGSTTAGGRSYMAVGLVLTIVAGVLSGVFNISLEYGQPIADLAAAKGAGQFQGNAKLIVSTAGCWVVNLVWFLAAGIRQRTLHEFTARSGISAPVRLKNFGWSALAGSLWFLQFFFYGLGHVAMGSFRFASWVLHMSMLIFFSYIIGMMMNEWKMAGKPTVRLLMGSLIVLVFSFFLIAFGSSIGEWTGTV